MIPCPCTFSVSAMLMCAAFLAGRGAVSGMFLFLFYFYLAVVCGVWLRVSKAVA